MAQLFAIKSGVASTLQEQQGMRFGRPATFNPEEARLLQERGRVTPIESYMDRSASLPLSEASSGRSSSIGSDILNTNTSIFDTALLDTNLDIDGAQGATPTERWRRSLKLVQKGLAFSKVFRTLRDMSKENTVDPARLTKLREIGTGAFATVDVCMMESEIAGNPPAQVAVKRLRYEALRHRQDLERFFKEASMLRRLRHRYIAGYVGVGNFSNEAIESMSTHLLPAEARRMLKSTFIVQEYVPGGSLKDLVLEQMLAPGRRVYTDQNACIWMRQVAEGLHYLHSSVPKVVHRDLKLENILMRDLGGKTKEACLVDFGMSVFLPTTPKRRASTSSAPSRRKKSSTRSEPSAIDEGSQQWFELSRKIDDNLERSDTAMAEHRDPPDPEQAKTFDLTGKTGSFMFMAPEVFRAQAYNEKADVFSFACILYEVFARFIVSTAVVGPTGNPDAARVYAHKVAQGYRRPLPKGMPIPLQHLISNCWAQDPQDRPDMEEVEQRLEALEESGVFKAVDEANQTSCSGCAGCAIM